MKSLYCAQHLSPSISLWVGAGSGFPVCWGCIQGPFLQTGATTGNATKTICIPFWPFWRCGTAHKDMSIWQEIKCRRVALGFLETVSQLKFLKSHFEWLKSWIWPVRNCANQPSHYFFLSSIIHWSAQVRSRLLLIKTFLLYRAPYWKVIKCR